MRHISIVVLICLFIAGYLPSTQATYVKSVEYHKDGHVVLGGLFPLHYTTYRSDNYSLLSKPLPVECEKYNFLGFRWMQAMIYAVEEINNRSDILPDVKLGFELFDSCNAHARAVSQTLHMVNSMYNNVSTEPHATISAVVGPTESAKSIVVSNILSVFDITQVSYASTSRILSDKTIFNSFFRTIPNDDEQATAMVELLKHHNWTWVGAVAGDDDYGRPGVSRLKQEAAKAGICVEYSAYVSRSMSTAQLRKVAQEIRDYNATVFVLFISATHLVPLAEQLRILNVTGKVWIASEAWATSNTVQQLPGAEDIFKGTLGIATRGGAMPGFRTFLEGVSPQSQPKSPFLKEFWERSFNCHCPHDVCTCPGEYDKWHHHADFAENCTGNEDLAHNGLGKAYLGWTGDDLEKTYNVYLAVYVIAQALEQITNCVEGFGLLENGTCPHISTLQPWQLLAYMKKVEFYPPGQNLQFKFDSNGDPNASYKLVSWKPIQKPAWYSDHNHSHTLAKFELVHAGNYSISTQPKWSINDSAIYWAENQKTAPSSVCSAPCMPGFFMNQLPSPCCFRCLPCADGTYSTNGSGYTCLNCGIYERANSHRTGCIPKIEEYVRWNDAFGISFCCVSILGIIFTLITCGAFIHKRETPLVKATNRELSFFLFVSIIFCFLTPFFYVSKPADWSCKGRNLLFSLSFTFCISAILVKTLRVLTAFNAKVPVMHRRRAKWLGEHLQLMVVMAISFVQVVLCVTWLLVEPPSVERVINPATPNTMVLACEMGSIPIVACVYGYLCILALTAFVLAFRARKLPENFNEAKFVTFAMLIFFIVWLSFIPAYLTTEGTSSTAVYCIAILASTYGLLGCIFFPKLYVIFVTPNRNTIQEVRRTTASHAMKSTRSVLCNVNATTTTTDGQYTPSTGRKSNSMDTPDNNGLRYFSGTTRTSNATSKYFKRGTPHSTSITESKRLKWRRKFLEQDNGNSNVASPKQRSTNGAFRPSSRDSEGGKTSKSVTITEERTTGTANEPGCKIEASSDNAAATIRVGIEGTISSSISSVDSLTRLSKTLQCDEPQHGGTGFNLKVDVKVNIQPGTANQQTALNDPPPVYEETDMRQPLDGALPLSRDNKTTRNTENRNTNNNHTSLLSDVSTTSSTDTDSEGFPERLLIKNGDALKETSLA
uniref:Extracellular calcium-sensing receptor-like n=1 Tax=Phallusia mammillata TaxID=59560 RepID=A0A6F9D872_9ASCI|nr:extracellular calcium-sensing receptor-like [Phallusia mammillata]